MDQVMGFLRLRWVATGRGKAPRQPAHPALKRDLQRMLRTRCTGLHPDDHIFLTDRQGRILLYSGSPRLQGVMMDKITGGQRQTLYKEPLQKTRLLGITSSTIPDTAEGRNRKRRDTWFHARLFEPWQWVMGVIVDCSRIQWRWQEEVRRNHRIAWGAGGLCLFALLVLVGQTLAERRRKTDRPDHSSGPRGPA